MAAAKKAALPGPSRGRKLTIGFGLVNVPVAFKPLTETSRPVSGKIMCPDHGPTCNSKVVCSVGTDDEHMVDEPVKGYPHPDNPDQYVVVDGEVVKALEESRTGAAVIEKMVDVGLVDPAYYDKTYLVWPQPGGEQAYDLLTAALRESGKAAVTTTVLTKQEQTVVFRWSEPFGALLGHVVHFDSMLRHSDAELVRQGVAQRGEPNEQMVDAALALLSTLEGDFDATDAADTLTPLMHDAIRAAADGKTYTVKPAATTPVEVPDMLAALRASVEEQGAKKKKPATKKPRVKAAA